MTTTHERRTTVGHRPTDRRPDVAAVLLLTTATVGALLALATGVVLSYLVFPEPTMWRLVVVGAALVGSVAPLRRLIGLATRRARRATVRGLDRSSF
ncbi:hypothetical protein SAMN04515671_3221 [Nakamurella panacisegetis]|uniref:Uncharacterized protein n=1 Tax=Nakamurella panacisegetis TaxID=1090615 RepID=A0A1H0QT91_9ACTN|nr:hypothetical protein [Nakamurella panacisegetis]SDP19908.1 hypothetical protein SAMN04515671_3221 [Nakamurella panacisegetis]